MLVVDAATGVVTSLSEIDDKGTIVRELKGNWACAVPADGSATTLVFTFRKDTEGAFPAAPIIRAG
ncbi:MAG: hypothetical protein KJ062_21220 [Thermoanaerobaculia bacterium]|nr:hypothetical protein [Thermoanaerobaculia bacterium]